MAHLEHVMKIVNTDNRESYNNTPCVFITTESSKNTFPVPQLTPEYITLTVVFLQDPLHRLISPVASRIQGVTQANAKDSRNGGTGTKVEGPPGLQGSTNTAQGSHHSAGDFNIVTHLNSITFKHLGDIG
eukprot:sb/3475191/